MRNLRHRILRPCISTGVVALLLQIALVFAALAAPSPQEQDLADLLINASGQQRPFLKYDPILNQVARARAQDMARRGYFSHVDPDGNGPNYLVERAGYPLPENWGDSRSANYIESIAGGRPTAGATWSDFMGSAPHKQHLLAEVDFYQSETSYGIGFAEDPGSEYRYYWVVITAPPRPVPALRISSPAPNSKVTSASVAVSGTASSPTPIQQVVARVENAEGSQAFKAASGTSQWRISLDGLVPGPNTIRIRSLDANGSVLAEVSQKVRYAVMAPLNVSVTGNGTVTNGFLGQSNRELGASYTVVAKPAAGFLFAGWSGGMTGENPRVTFTMPASLELVANFVPNPFLTTKGTYSGVLTNANSGVGGSITATLNANGTVTGKLNIGAAAYAFGTKLGLNGTASVTVSRKNQPPLTVQLTLDLTGASGFTVSLTGDADNWTADAMRNLPAAQARTLSGRYTLSLVPSSAEPGSAVPQGDGFGTLLIDRFGRATLIGFLADGQKFTEASAVTEGNKLPLFSSLYGKLGYVGGVLEFRTTDTSDLDGTLVWNKPQRPNDRFYPTGFVTQLPVIGSRYVAPAAGQRVIAVAPAPNNSTLSLGDGNLQQPVLQLLTLDGANRISTDSPLLPGLSIRISTQTGFYKGEFTHPASGEVSPVKGVIFQKQNAGFGFFLGVNESGYASFTPTL